MWAAVPNIKFPGYPWSGRRGGGSIYLGGVRHCESYISCPAPRNQCNGSGQGLNLDCLIQRQATITISQGYNGDGGGSGGDNA